MLIYTYKLRYFVDFFLVLFSLATFCDTLLGAKNYYRLKCLEYSASQSEGEPKRKGLPRGSLFAAFNASLVHMLTAID
jgi:hypothetical protein